ncbi:hypothetical protein SB781_40010, partial [Paraburkholderia sp. SIMBA_061]
REMQPFRYDDGDGIRSGDLILHDFSWPRDELQDFGNQAVTMRVTLSYFIEPNPGERGWSRRHSYASHGLRFNVKMAEE